MRIGDWLKLKKIKRSAFAEQIGKSPSYVSQLCSGAIWPGRPVVELIAELTEGAVTAQDFMTRQTEKVA